MFFKDVTQQDVIKFMKKKENAELIEYLDKWFTSKIEERNTDDILTLIKCFTIFLGIVGREIVELQAIINSGDKSYNA